MTATLSFVALQDGVRCTDVYFRSHVPPTRIADTDGQPMLPLQLWATPPPSSPADFAKDCDVDFIDFGVLSGCLGGPDSSTPPSGCGGDNAVKTDLDGDGDVDLGDFAIFQMEYTGP